MSDFGNRLKELRKSKLINQRDLADGAQIDPTYLSKVETGKMVPPAEDTIKRLAKVLGEDPTELLLLARKIPADVKDILTGTPEVTRFLRTAHQQGWSGKKWERLRQQAESQPELFDEDKGQGD